MTTAPTSIRVAALGELPPGRCKVVEVAGRSIAVFHAEGRFYATDDSCLHQGGPLGEGDLDGTRVVCPWHGWGFDLVTGQCDLDPDLKLARYPVRVEDGAIFVDVDGASAGGTS